MIRLWDEQATAEVGEAALAALHDRAFGRGLDVRDQPFAPYSSGYAARLKAAGESTRVDLRRTGRLEAAVLGSLEVGATEARLALTGEEAQVAARIQVTREFWGISPIDRSAIAEAVRSGVLGALERGR